MSPTVLLLLLALSTALANQRVVVTFRNASLNAEATVPESATVVKQYGRRLVLKLLGQEQETIDQLAVEEWVQKMLGGEDVVESVEQDAIASSYDEVVDDAARETAANTTAIQANLTESNTHSTALWNSAQSTTSVAKGWNLEESEPYALHIQTIRALTTGQGTTIAIIDSGIAQVAKPVFQPATGYDFISSPDYSNKPNQTRNPDYTDPGDQGPTCPTPSWHGTKVASIASTIAPGATLTVMRVLGQCGVGFSSDIADAIVWAAGGKINGLGANPFPASTVSLSLAGKSACPSYLQSAVSQARSLGATVIVAAGNAAQNASLYFPANCAGVVVVGASTRQGTMASYSNWGEGVTFSAPGGDSANPIPVLCPTIDGTILISTKAIGTSFAAPHASGMAALLRTGRLSVEAGGLFVPYSSGCDAMVCSLMGVLSSWRESNGTNTTPSNSSSSPYSTQWPPADSSINVTVTTADSYRTPQGGSWSCTTESAETNYGQCRRRPGGSGGSWQAKAYNSGQYSGYPNSGANGYSFTCDPGCFITGVFAGNVGSTIKRLQFECSNGKVSQVFGDQSSGYWYRDALGVAAIYACADNDYNQLLWGITIYNYALAQIGQLANGQGCDEDVMFTDTGKLITGFDVTAISSAIAQIRPIFSRIQCPSTHYMSSVGYSCNSCDQCGSGYYAYGCGGTSAGNCYGCGRDCPNLQYRAGCGGLGGGWCADCNVCDAGSWFAGCTGGELSDTHSCIACDAGKYGGGGFQRSCQECWTGKYNPSAGQDSEGACQRCQAGKYNPNTGSNTIAACRSCPAGKTLLNTGASSDSECVACATGTFSYSEANGVGCTACPAGKYNDEEGRTACKLCAAGTYGPATGAKVACTQCGFGKYGYTEGASSEGGACELCAAGKYNSIAGTQLCTQCAPGKYALTTGAQGCTDCGKGTYSTATGWNKACALCAAGKYNPDSAGSSLSFCKDCEAGKYGPGQALSACTPCLQGTFTGTAGNTVCGQCLAGTFTLISGTVQCQSCTPLTDCAAGTEYTCVADSGSRCAACAVIYACEYLTSRCFSSGSDPSCLCAAGFEMTGGRCVGCAEGKYKSAQGNTPCAAITAPVCVRGQYLQPGSAYANAACVDCPALPPSAVQAAAGCEWTCSAGFDNNAP